MSSYPPSPNRSSADQGDRSIDAVLQPTPPLRTPIRNPGSSSIVTPSSSLRVPNASPPGPTFRAQSPPRSTHAGGILPPAHFFRPSRPNSSTSPGRPISTASPSGSVGRSTILPFKSPASPPGRSTALPSTFGSRSPGANVGSARTRDPLLPIGERKQQQQQQPPPVVPVQVQIDEPGPSASKGVRSSLERLWRRKSTDSRRREPDLESASVAEGPDAEEEGPFELDDQHRPAVDEGEEQDTSVDTIKQPVSIYPPGPEPRLPLSYQVPYTPTPPALEEEPRNRFVLMDESSSRPGTPRRLTIDDIGDGDVDGGGVVMEMGRISMSGRTPSLMGGRTPSLVGTARTMDDDDTGIVVNDAVRVRAGDISPRTPGGGRAVQANLSFDVHEGHRPDPSTLRPLPSNRDVIPQPTSSPSSPGPQPRHARFAPSPRRSPKVTIHGVLPDDATTYSSSAASSSPYVHRARTSVSSPPYLIPVLSPRTSKPVRNYEIHPSKNRYFFGGHLIAGGDSAVPFLGALTLLLGIAGLWFGTTCVWWWHRGAGGQAVAIVGGYMLLLTLSSMLMTAFRDPGILPRDLDPDPPYPATASVTSENSPAVPLPRDLRVRAGSVRVKYCVTCKTYRPPRSSHCKMCDNCVDGCDHHCQWVNNCVGRRNYTYFITFVVAASFTTLMVLATGIVMIYLQAHENRWGARDGFRHAIGSTVAVGLCLIVIWPLLALTLYHVRLLLLNITTIEQVRNQAHKKLTHAQTPPNPFSIGRWYHNVAYLYYRPPGYSWVDFAGYAVHDTRKVNPGFVIRPASTAEDHGPNSRESEEARWR